MKTCVLCSNSTLSPRHKLCTTCYKEHGKFIQENWFLELVKLQRKQDEIDNKEGYVLSPSITFDIPVVSSKKNIGRPSTDWRLVNEVLKLYDESLDLERQGISKRLSLRALEKKMNHRVKYLTIRRILLTYRKQSFPRNKNV